MSTANQRSRMGFLLAGGKSTRIGANKAFLDCGGHTLIDRAILGVRSVCPSYAIVGDPAKFSDYGPVIEDLYPGCGPLAGIHAALRHSSADLNLVLAVDLPFVSEKLLAFLFTAAEQTDAIVVVPRTARGLHPLCAVYRREFAEAAEQALRAGKYKIDALFPTLPVRIVEEDELKTAGFSEQAFFNVNTPNDLAAARAHFRS